MNNSKQPFQVRSKGISKPAVIVVIAFVTLIGILIGIFLPNSDNTSNGNSQVSTDETVPVIDINPLVIDFRNITSNQDANAAFTISNPGNEPLQIIDIISSCACLKVEPRKSNIAPGKSTTFTTTLLAPPLQNIAVNFELNIYTGPTTPPVILPVVGEMEELFFFDLSYNENNELNAVTITAKGGDEFSILEVPQFINFDTIVNDQPATSFFLPINTSFQHEENENTDEHDHAYQLVLHHAFHGEVNIFWKDNTKPPKRPDPAMEPLDRNLTLTHKQLQGEEEVEISINGPMESDFSYISVTTASSSPLGVKLNGYEVVPGGLKLKLLLTAKDKQWERTPITFLYKEKPTCVIRLIHPDYQE